MQISNRKDKLMPTMSTRTTISFGIQLPNPSMNEGMLGEIVPGDSVMYEAAEAWRCVRIAAKIGARLR